MSLIGDLSFEELCQASFLLDSMTAAVISTDLDFIIKSWNKAAEEIYGLTAVETIGLPAGQILTHEFLSGDCESTAERLQLCGKWKGEVLQTRKDGSKVYLEINISWIKDDDGKNIGYVAVCRDISSQKNLEKMLIGEEKRKKSEIIKAIMEAQEKERKELSSELHDNVNQILTTCKLLLEIARNNPADSSFIDTCYKNIHLVIQEIRNISHNLTPHTLKDLGLAAAILDIAEKINQSGKLVIRLIAFKSLEEDKISPDIKLTLFRIIQEIISNVLKHSRANELKIGISTHDNRVQLRLSDDGQGFDEKTVKKGLGLNNIYNRVEYYKGSIELRTSAGQGCAIYIELPCSQ